MVDAKPPKASPNSKGEDGKEQLEIKPDDPWEINLPFKEIPEHDMRFIMATRCTRRIERQRIRIGQIIYEVVQQIKPISMSSGDQAQSDGGNLLTRISLIGRRSEKMDYN